MDVLKRGKRVHNVERTVIEIKAAGVHYQELAARRLVPLMRNGIDSHQAGN